MQPDVAFHAPNAIHYQILEEKQGSSQNVDVSPSFVGT
jgi:hypothetical protein